MTPKQFVQKHWDDITINKLPGGNRALEGIQYGSPGVDRREVTRHVLTLLLGEDFITECDRIVNNQCQKRDYRMRDDA